MNACISFLLLIAPVSSALTLFGVKEVRMDQLAQCGGDDANTPVRIVNVIINYDSTTMKIDAQFVFDTTVNGKIYLRVELVRCTSRQESDTCENHSHHQFIVYCRQLFEEGKMWTDYVKRIENLPKQCPITPETYNVTGVTIELKNLKALPLGPGYWKVKGKAKMNNKDLFCAVSQLDIQIQRSRNRKQSG